MTALGFTLQPEERTLALLAAVIREEPDYYEVAPETLWRRDGAGGFRPNGFHELFGALAAETRKPFVAHGVGMSLGTVRPDATDQARRLARVAADHAAFRFLWYTDHLGATALDGMELTLPMPPFMCRETAGVVRTGLAAMRAVVGREISLNTAWVRRPPPALGSVDRRDLASLELSADRHSRVP